MTERDFYKALLAGELGQERLLEDVKAQTACKKPFNTWVRAVAAVFCVILLGGIGAAIGMNGMSGKFAAKSNNAESAAFSTPRSAQVPLYDNAAGVLPGDAADDFKIADEEELLHRRQLETLSGYADCIVIAAMNGEQELTVVKGLRAAQAGQVLKTAYCELPEGEEYLLFLMKDAKGYVPLLAGNNGVYRADSQTGEYWLRDFPAQRRPIAEIEALA